MTTLFQRAVEVNAAGKLLDGIDVEFTVNKSLKKEPNTGEITIYNLSEDSRRFISEQKRPVIEIRAGYQKPGVSEGIESALTAIGVEGDDSPPLLFRGEMKEAVHKRQGPDWLTVLRSGDGAKARRANINQSFKGPVQIEKVLEKAADAMGVSVGNAIAAFKKGDFGGGVKEFFEGVTLSGNAGEELEKLLKSKGLQFSIQNEELQVLPRGGAVNSRAVLITPSTGLIGSPEPGEENRIKARSLLNPEIYPGRKVAIQSAAVDATYVVIQATYSGATNGADYAVEFEGVLPQ